MTLSYRAFFDTLSFVLQEERWRQGLTQCELARKSGVGVKTISSYESGARTETMKIDHLVRITDALGVTPAVVFWRAEEEMVGQSGRV